MALYPWSPPEGPIVTSNTLFVGLQTWGIHQAFGVGFGVVEPVNFLHFFRAVRPKFSCFRMSEIQFQNENASLRAVPVHQKAIEGTLGSTTCWNSFGHK